MTQAAIKTVETLSRLEAVYQRGYHDELVDRTLGKLLDFEREKAQRELRALQSELQRFEVQYHRASAKFYQQFQQDTLGDAADYFEWSACYDMYQAVFTRLTVLNDELSSVH